MSQLTNLIQESIRGHLNSMWTSFKNGRFYANQGPDTKVSDGHTISNKAGIAFQKTLNHVGDNKTNYMLGAGAAGLAGAGYFGKKYLDNKAREAKLKTAGKIAGGSLLAGGAAYALSKYLKKRKQEDD